MTTFFRLLDVEDKANALKECIAGKSERVFEVAASNLSCMPGSPFSYWLEKEAIAKFESLPPFETDGRTARQGLATADNFRFVRVWWEVPPGSEKWAPLAKGGNTTPFYGELSLVMNWEADGAEMKAWATSLYNNSHWSRIIMNSSFYFKPGLTFARRPHKRGRFQFLPEGCLFSTDSPMIASSTPMYDCAILNGDHYNYMLDGLMARGTSGGQTLKYETGYVTSVPIPSADATVRDKLSLLALEGYKAILERYSRDETSRQFRGPAFADSQSTAQSNVEGVLGQINAISAKLYDFNIPVDESDNPGASIGDEDASEISETDEIDENASLISLSWSVGIAFGRFKLRSPGVEISTNSLPSPFTSLPAKSPGMVQDGEAALFPTSGIFVDDQGHPDDLPMRIIEVYEAAGQALPDQAVIRRLLAEDFFSAHIRMYTKSRRKAPIYWQLATPSGSYSVWLYLHALTKDTLLRVQNDYVAPKLAHERRELENLRSDAGPNPSAAQLESIAKKESFIDELQAFANDLNLVTPLWNPNLDDGVAINFAILWRLVSQNKPWQRELKGTWDALVAGQYDWSSLAMRLWPERVIAKCASDRSLAIAHGIENKFWFEDGEGKWRSVGKPIPAEYHASPSVKSALKNLIEAPDLSTKQKRSRKGKST